MAYSQPVYNDGTVGNTLRSEREDQESQSQSTPNTHFATPNRAIQVCNMDKFFEHRKSDLMFELRNIQHSERPVTGQSHRDHLQQFMKKHLASNDVEPGKENVPANVDTVEEHRPESIVFEVQGIIEQRPVSSVLQSASFRRHLENIIRGSIFDARHQNNQSPRARIPTPSHAVPAPTPTTSTETRTERPRLIRNESHESVSSQESFSSARSSVDQDLDENDEILGAYNEPSAIAQRGNPDSSHSESRQGNNPTAQQGEESSSNPDIAREGLTWQDINRVHRDELVEELSELVHSRLVSSSLDSGFRATLEMLVQNRVSSSGMNGPAVQEFVRSLPGRGIPRNDFSHLGIAPLENENWDNISVTSFSAHSVPYTQTNTYLSREIQGLKSAVSEMKNMMKMSLDMQMDIQRAIRQEVAAALSQISTQGASAADIPTSRPVSDTHCLICLERHSDSVLYQCGHMCVCYICGKNLISRNHTCPVCRAPIKDVIRAYKTNID